MKAAIYNPYLDTLGGGERYTMAFATTLVDLGYRVDVQWKNILIKEKLEKRFGINLKGIYFVDDIKRGDGYDVCFWLSDGSIPLLRARKNFIHFQFPFRNVNGRSLLNRMKLFRVEKVICNSYFTKSHIDDEYGVNSLVLYPPVDVKSFKPKLKENVILFVGRFSQLGQAKNQLVLVETFKKLQRFETEDWKLILAGGVEVGVDDYLERLMKLAKGCPIEVVKSPDFGQLKSLYGKAKLFWSAVGFGIDENRNPTKVEHFGITVVEAMAAGCVPIVYAAGGHKEIIADGFNGFLWESKNELLKKTKTLIEDKGLMRTISVKAKESAKVYEYERFLQEVKDIVS